MFCPDVTCCVGIFFYQNRKTCQRRKVSDRICAHSRHASGCSGSCSHSATPRFKSGGPSALIRRVATHHLPFDSHYREGYEVVEERHGRTRLYPHTQQLPIILRALNLEFHTALPGKIARVDKRGDGYHKCLRDHAGRLFCSAVNVARKDDLRLHCILDRDMVARISIVQHITEEDPRGATHRFRFYAGEDFFPEILLNGRRVVFADHVLQRFSKRLENPLGEDLTHFLLLFYGTALIGLRIGPGLAFMSPYGESMLALPYKEVGDDEFFVLSCLTLNEMHSLDREAWPLIFNHHYDRPFVVPLQENRNWNVHRHLQKLYHCWERKIPLPPRVSFVPTMRWAQIAARMPDYMRVLGIAPDVQISFLDNIPGPLMIEHYRKTADKK
jgi:hypothetical protein